MNTKHRQVTLLLILAMLFCVIPEQRVMAKTEAELTKIGATAKIPDGWVLINTDMSNQEIMKLLDIDDEVTLSSIRAQWERSPAKIEYDVVIKDEDADILVNTVDARGSNLQEGNELSDGVKESLMQSVKTGLKTQGAVVSEFERADVAGQFGWKIQMTLGGTEAYEYQILHQGKYITFSINEINGKLSQKKKEFLDEFIRDLTIPYDASSQKENTRSLVMWLYIGGLGGIALVTVIAAITVLIYRRRKRQI